MSKGNESLFLKRQWDRLEEEMERAEYAMDHYRQALEQISRVKRRKLLEGAEDIFENGCNPEYFERIKW